MLKIRLRDTKQVKMVHNHAKSGENIKYLHLFGIKYFGISGVSGAFLSGINGIILCAFSE